MNSSEASIEADWAVNRVGYNWSELWSINPDGTYRSKVMDANQIWTSPVILQSRIEYTEAGTIITSSVGVRTGTNAFGFGMDANACNT